MYHCVYFLVPPEIIEAPTREDKLDLSSSSVQNYTLRCNASGDPPPNIKWTKAGVPVSKFNATGHLLHLVDVQREDAGSYICTASNGFGDNATAIGLLNIGCKYSKLNWFNEEDMYIAALQAHVFKKSPFGDLQV